MGFLAIDKKAFNKVSAADQAIVREVMTRTYAQLNDANLQDNDEALQALLNTGIKIVGLPDNEVAEIRSILRKSNRDMAEQGDFSLQLYGKMLQHWQDYRVGSASAAGN